MKKKHFYTHILEIDSIHIELDELDLSHDEKHELLDIAESAIHHAILNTILSRLTQHDKKVFLQYMVEDNHEKVWRFLSEKIENAQDTIVETIHSLKKELHDELKQSKKIKKLHEAEQRNI